MKKALKLSSLCFAALIFSFFSLSVTAKSYFTLLCDGDERGQHAEIVEIKPEPNITGLAILLKNKLVGPNGSLDQISFVWSKQESATNKKIIKSLQKEVSAGIGLEANDIWLIGKLVKNSQAPYAHTAAFHAYKVMSSRSGMTEVEIHDLLDFAK